MIPKTLSATSLQVANLCMKRWEVEYLNRTPGFSGVAANVGSSCHGALEKFVEMVFIDKVASYDWNLLKDLYHVSYVEVFGTADTSTDEFKDGLQMLQRWFKRSYDQLNNCTVESVEIKKTLMVPALLPTGETIEFPLNYIMDRVDKTGDTTYRIVDYKSVRVPIQPEELHSKFQARIYGLAVQIEHPDATEIKVVFDLLRHDQVGTTITRQDNIDTWYWLKGEAQRIVDTPEDPHPTLNMECGYCVMKATCPVLQKNIAGGGIHSLDIDEVANLKYKIESQAKAQKILLEELEERLLKEAVAVDSLEYSTETMEVVVTASRRRQVDASMVAQIIGPEMFGKLGSITIGVIDELIKDETLEESQRNALKELIYFKLGDPKAKVKRKATLV